MTLGEIEIQHMRIEIGENSKQEPHVTVSATTVTGDRFVKKENPNDQEEVTSSQPLVDFVTDIYKQTKAKLEE
jgi:hypothetical protein|tara:strand:+ start:1109 stop:1327 length:219 start_codon:yes stop_codon:yes gene_type:complete